MEQVQAIPDASPERRVYIAVQIAIIRSMIKRGIIKTATEYVDNGHAEAFKMFWDGILRCATEGEVESMREEAIKLTSA